MKHRFLFPLLTLCAAGSLAAQDASVTLFSSGRTLVRRTLPLTIPAGSSSQVFPLGLFEPATLTSLDPGATITRVGYDPATSEEALLRRSVGKRFSFVREAQSPMEVSATLVGLDPERWRLTGGANDGQIVFGRPGRIAWPADLVPKAPVTDVQVQSDRARTALRVMYQSGGAAWSAQYRIFVGGTARVEGSAMLSSGRLDLANAEVQLLAGDIGAPPPMAPAPMMAMAEARAYKAADAAPSEEAVGEARLYTLPDRVTFVPGTQTVIPLFAPVAATAERRFTVRGALQWYGGVGQEPEEQVLPVAVTWRLDRKNGTPFGDLPLPAGSVAVFDVDRAGRPQLVGQGNIGHTAPGEVLTVSTGTAFDVTAKRTQTEYTTTRPSTNRTVSTVGYSVVLSNAKDSAVVVEVIEQRGGEWSVLSSSVPAQRRSATVTAFQVTVPPKGSATLTYRLRVVW